MLGAQCHQTGHLLLGQANLLATELMLFDVGDLESGAVRHRFSFWLGSLRRVAA
jgi:hypothetical protein